MVDIVSPSWHYLPAFLPSGERGKKGNTLQRRVSPERLLTFSLQTKCSFSAKDNINSRFFSIRLGQTDNNLLKSVFHSYFIARGNRFQLESRSYLRIL